MKKIDESLIPEGDYCYKYLETPRKENNFRSKVYKCPYWHSTEDGASAYCDVLDIEDAICLWDQIKECGINQPEKEYESI